MVIGTETAVAIHCPLCGRLKVHIVSLFDFSGCQSIHLTCSCGGHKIVIKSKNKKKYWIETECAMCEGKHSIPFSTRDFLSSELICICCPETQIELGMIGPREKVMERAEHYQEDLEQFLNEVGFDDYFDDPEVMFETINHLHDVAEADGLYCRCGNRHIEVDIYADRVELTCPECGGKGFIYARNEEDLKELHQKDEIVLTLQGIKGGRG